MPASLEKRNKAKKWGLDEPRRHIVKSFPFAKQPCYYGNIEI